MAIRPLKYRLAAAVAAAALAAAACGGDDDPSAETGTELRVNLNSDPQHLVPTNVNESEGLGALRMLYKPLISYNPETGEPINVVAESIETEDNVTWTITLKDGWTFHNGEPVDADAFIRSWNFAAFGPSLQVNNYFFDRIDGFAEMQYSPDQLDEEGAPIEGAVEPEVTELSGLRKVDDLTIEVTLSQPFASFNLMLGYMGFAPLAQECLDDLEACELAPIGNGPFQIDGQWEHDEAIRMTKWDDYPGEQPSYDRLTFRIYSDNNTAYNDLLAGNIDLMRPVVPDERRAEARTQFGDRFLEEPRSSFTYLGFPLYDEKFADVNLRRALSLAIDRQLIIDNLLDGAMTPAGGVVAPTMPGARTDACEYCVHDPDQAKDLLAEAGGWPEGEKLQLWFNSGSSHDIWVEAIGNQLRDTLGIDFEMNELEFADYLERTDPSGEGVNGPFRLGWGMDYPSPENYLKPLYGTQGSSNRPQFSDDTFDQLIAQGDAAESLDDAIGFYQQAEDIVLDQLPVIPLWFGLGAVAYNENVDNVVWDIVDGEPVLATVTVQ